MKICLAQAKAVKGNIAANIENHKRLVKSAASQGASMVVFPELSLTGYEPSLAAELATGTDDPRFAVLRNLCDSAGIVIVAGMPIRHGKGVFISMLLFQPDQPLRLYSKKYLHADEEPFFVSGPNFPVLQTGDVKVGLGICYELSVPEHAEAAFEGGAGCYLVSAVKSVNGIAKAHERLSEIAAAYSAPALLCNSVGESDGFTCGGQSACWDTKGRLLAQLNAQDEGLLLFNTGSGEAEAVPL